MTETTAASAPPDERLVRVGPLSRLLTRPVWALHVLVVPRRHIRSVAELADTELAGRLVLVASRIAAEAGAKSFRLATNSGAPLQDVFHLHWHVMADGAMGHPAGIAFSRPPQES